MALKGASYYMNGHMETQLGKVTIDPEVIATYAGSVAVECFGIVGMAAVNMLVTESGSRIIGDRKIPVTVEELEGVVGK